MQRARWTFLVAFIRVCQVSVRRGSARSRDHAQLVHSQWLHAAKMGVNLWIQRVATEENIADLPSRMPALKRIKLLEEHGAVLVEPLLHDVYKQQESWEVLQHRWRGK